jgi:hypothetical protein
MANYKVRMIFSPHTIHSIGIGGRETIYIHISGQEIPKNATILEYRDVEKVKKCKAVPLQAWSGPEGSRKLRFPDFLTTAQDSGKVVSPTHRPHLRPGNTPGTHFC